MNKVYLFCPSCNCIMTVDSEDPELEIVPATSESKEFNAKNAALFENCNCNEDYVYFD
jgi:hypothetical protein